MLDFNQNTKFFQERRWQHEQKNGTARSSQRVTGLERNINPAAKYCALLAVLFK